MFLNCSAEGSWESLKEIKPVNSKGNILYSYSLGGLMLKLRLQYFGHLMQRASSLEKALLLWKIECRRRKGWQRMRWLDGIIDWMDVSLGDSEGHGILVSCSPWCHKEWHDSATEQVQQQAYINKTDVSSFLISFHKCTDLFLPWQILTKIINYVSDI